MVHTWVAVPIGGDRKLYDLTPCEQPPQGQMRIAHVNETTLHLSDVPL